MTSVTILSSLIKMKPGTNIFMNISVHNDKTLLVLMLFSTIATGLIPAITSILTGRVFDLLSNIISDKHSIPEELTARSMALMALGAASFPVMWALISSWMFLGERQGFRIRDKMLVAYLNKPFQWYDNNVELLGNFTQLNRCIEEVRQSSSEAAAIIFQSVVTVCALIGTSFYYSWSLTLIILCSTPLIVIIAIILSRLINQFINLENEETSKAANVLVWSMKANGLIKINNTQKLEVKKFDQLVTGCNNLFIKGCFYSSLNSSSIRFLTLCMFVQGFWFGSSMIRRGKLNINDVITCFHSCLMLGATLSEVFHQIVILQKGDVANTKISKFLKDGADLNKETITLNQKVVITPKKIILNESIDIVFQNVSFKYPSRPHVPILQNVSLHFPANQLTFIVGRSGSGKSTLSKILLKFYPDYEGEVQINNVSIEEIDQDWIIKNVTVVEQNCKLFNDTIKNNILLGHGDFQSGIDMNASPSIMQNLPKACTFALLDRVIDELPDGLDTVIGSEGVTLSGGQAQRVALARAFMRNTPVLILDEAVSALDIIHRQLLMEAIRTWRNGKTTIVLTHDLGQIDSNDLLYVVENGCILESGTKDKLLNKNKGRFKELYEVEDSYALQHAGKLKSVPNLEGVHETDNLSEKSILSDTEIPIDYKEKIWTNIPSIETSVENPIHRRKTNNRTRRLSNELNSIQRRCLAEENQILKKTPESISLPKIIQYMIHDLNHKYLLFMGIISSLLAGAANPIFSYAFSYLLNGIVPNQSGTSSSYYLLKWSFIVIGISVGDGVFNFMKSFILGYCSEIWILNLRKQTMKVIQYNDFEWFRKEENRPAEISAVILNDLRDLRNLVTEFLGTISTFIVVSLCGLIWALVAGWKLSLVCISMFPLIIIFSGIYGYFLQQYETEYKTDVAKLENCLFEIVTGIRTIRYLQLQDYFIKKHMILKEEIQIMARKRAFITGVGISFTYTLTLGIQAILFYYGLKLVFVGEYTSKKMFETFTLLLFTIMTCSNLVNQIPEVARGQRAAVWIYRIIRQHEKTREAFDEHGRQTPISHYEDSKSLIKVQNLSFSYPGETCKLIYNNLNLTLGSNQTVAFVGESGTGKSTLISLLTRLYTPSDNSIFIDGTDVNEWNLGTLREQISIVEQAPVVFNGTIKENLTYGLFGEISEHDLISVLKYVDVYDFITTLPNVLDSQISTDLLSGGQLQRICIARALLKQTKIMILDECTSALDTESAKIIHDIVRNGISNKLTIVITHDKQMMKACDNIMVLKDGRMVQEGTFTQLMKLNGEFKRIVRQFGN